MLRHRLPTLSAALLAAAVMAPAQAAYNVVGISPASWGASDAALGLAPGAVIEDFEDTTLISGLTVQVENSSNGSYGPTGTLPRTFDPALNDAYGTVFVGGKWDGARVLINTGDNASANYGSSTAWGDVTFFFGHGGATQVGFSMQQMQQTAIVTINGSTSFTMGSVGGGLDFSGGRTGYVRIDATGLSAPITSLEIDGTIYDAWVVDHMAVTSAVPEPGTYLLMAAGLLAVGSTARRRR